mgnify:CR=1 FL=1
MTKVKLNIATRFYDSEGSNFNINAGEIKELPEKELKSYEIKSLLASGRLRVVEGELFFCFKNAKMFISSDFPDRIYGFDCGKVFEKELIYETISWPEDIPRKIGEIFGLIEKHKEEDLKNIEIPKIEVPIQKTERKKKK